MSRINPNQVPNRSILGTENVNGCWKTNQTTICCWNLLEIESLKKYIASCWLGSKKTLYWPLDVQVGSVKNPGPGPDHFPWKILQVQSSMVRRPTSPDQATVLVIKLMSAGVSAQYQTLTYWFKNTNSLLPTTLFWNQDWDVVWSMMLILLYLFPSFSPPHQWINSLHFSYLSY